MPAIFAGKCKSKARIDGKTVVITGANTGIGKETALDLARRGGALILACRTMSKAEVVAEEIRKAVPGASVTLVSLELGSLQSVRECAKQILDIAPKINILINNAGVMMSPKGTTVEGFETQFGTNHLGHFLFTMLLLDRIKESAPARIVNVSSVGHLFANKMNFDDLNLLDNYDASQSYFQSKLANVYFTKELAKRLYATGVNTYVLHPGAVKTELFRTKENASFLIKSADFMMRSFYKTPEEGAQTSIYCAVAEELENKSGLYYADCKEASISCTAKDEDAARKLWDASMIMVGLA